MAIALQLWSIRPVFSWRTTQFVLPLFFFLSENFHTSLVISLWCINHQCPAWELIQLFVRLMEASLHGAPAWGFPGIWERSCPIPSCFPYIHRQLSGHLCPVHAPPLQVMSVIPKLFSVVWCQIRFTQFCCISQNVCSEVQQLILEADNQSADPLFL